MDPTLFELNIGAIIVSVLLILLGAIIVGLVTKRLKTITFKGFEIEIKEEGEGGPPRANRSNTRIIEAVEALNRQEQLAKWSQRAGALLSFGQYVVGGVLTTSFIQESLSNKVVGLLGVLVLVSSLIYQQYRPDILARSARYRVIELRTVIRNAEDMLYEMRTDPKNAPPVIELRKMVSERLAEIEKSEIEEREIEKPQRN